VDGLFHEGGWVVSHRPVYIQTHPISCVFVYICYMISCNVMCVCIYTGLCETTHPP